MQMKIVKRQILRLIASCLAFCLIAATFAGCGETQKLNAYRSVGGALLESQVLASNSNYELSWDKDAKAVLYKHKDGAYWSDIWYEDYLNKKSNTNNSSPIAITICDTKTLKWETIPSSIEMQNNGNILCKVIENGIRVTYFFETYKIAVPVDYTLKEDHISISIDSSKILEDGTDYKLVSVSFMQNFAAVANSAVNGNLLIPSGTGALINTRETSEGTLKFSAPMYGRDAVSRIPYDREENEEMRLPVFGAYGDSKALFAIIESGEGSAFIDAESGNSRTGFSKIYPTFYVRGYDTFLFEYFGQDPREAKRVNENISNQVFSVAYYPMFGEEADFNGMAKKYQSYLLQKGELKKSTAKNSPYSVTFLGGTNITKSFFGIPYKKLSTLTTFSQAQKIIEDLKKNNGILPTVRLLGFNDNGVRPGKVAGGSSYPSEYGSKKELSSLIETCSNTDFFLDFDIVNYSKSGNGFSVGTDVAKTAIKYKAEVFPTNPVKVNDEENVYYLLGRDELLRTTKRVVNKADKYKTTGVSLKTLGEFAYSDYDDEKYINRYKMKTDAIEILSSVKKAGYNTAVSGANEYAAAFADVIFDVTGTAGDYDVFSTEIPFYQMVFRQYKPIYTEGINISTNIDREIAKAAAYGMGLGYYITDSYVSASDDLDEYKLYATVYEDNAKNITSVLNDKGFAELYNKISDSALINYEIVNDVVAKSTYSNGVVVFTNLSTKTVNSDIGELKPYEYKIG